MKECSIKSCSNKHDTKYKTCPSCRKYKREDGAFYSNSRPAQVRRYCLDKKSNIDYKFILKILDKEATYYLENSHA